MPDDQPSNAPDSVEPRDADTAAHAIVDQDTDAMPGGGGLGSPAAAAADPLAARTPAGTSPNAPIDVPTPDPAGGDEARAEAESRQQAAATAPEPRPASQ